MAATTFEPRTATAEVLEIHPDYTGDIVVMYIGTNASHPVTIYGRNGWTSTPFQNAGMTIMKMAKWLFSQGGCPTYIASLRSDGAGCVYQVEFAEQSDEDEGIVAGQPIDLEVMEDIDAPEEPE